MNQQLVIFDLDGTLLDTLADLCNSCNYILEKHHYPTHPLYAYRYFVGDGMMKLIERVLPENERTSENIELIYNEFITHYQIHKQDLTKPFDGIVELLDTLQERGYRIAVASNKAHAAMSELMRHYFPEIKFAAVLGKRNGVPTKPAPDIVFDILKMSGCVPENAWYVGDTATDMMTAANAGLRKVGVLWGYRERMELENANADFIIQQPMDLLKIIE